MGSVGFALFLTIVYGAIMVQQNIHWHLLLNFLQQGLSSHFY